MKKILLSSLIAGFLLTGCSAVYQSGQTPDDLYYANGKATTKSEVRNEEDEERYEEYVRTADDRYLRMKVANRNQWSSIDNFSYWNDMRYNFPSTYGYNNGFNYGNNFGFNHPGFNVVGSPWNAGWNNSWGFGTGFNTWNTWGYGNGIYGNRLGWNNPCYTLIAYTAPKLIPTTYTSGSNLGAYKNRTYNTINSNGNDKWGTPSTSGSGSNNNFGSLVRKVLAPSSNGSNGSYDRPARTFSNSSNGTPATSSSAGGSSGGFKSTGSSASTTRGGRGN